MILFSQLPVITGGKMLQLPADRSVDTLCIDSRKSTASPGTVFFAISGIRHDGHDYLPQLYRSGVRLLVVEKSPDLAAFPDAAFMLVDSSVAALQQLAEFRRKQFNIPVIGITGSNGKTIVKEWLYQMLSRDRVVVKNPGSYNSQVGVPLSVWQIQSYHQLGIFEAGISRPGEMEHLQSVIHPSIGLFTNIGTAHSEGFKDQEEKAREKVKLFAGCDTVVCCADHEPVRRNLSAAGLPLFTWGRDTDADLQVTFSEKFCEIRMGHQRHEIRLPFLEPPLRENVMHCIALMFRLNYPVDAIQTAVDSLKAIPMRMELKEGIGQCQIVDDTYNNDLGGLEIALQFLQHQRRKGNRRLILSDMLESGMPEASLVGRVASLVKEFKVQHLVVIGPVLSKHASLFSAITQAFESTDAFLRDFDTTTLREEIILVKGARVYEFERIVSRLEKKVHETVMEIDLNALTHNFNYFKSRLAPTTKIMVMVKAFAYGSGSKEIASILQYHRVDYLGVAYPDEGVDLRLHNITVPIMVMNPSVESFETLVRYGLEPELYSLSILRAITVFLQGKPCRVHLKLDTGMHRLGFDESDLDEVIALLQANPNVEVVSIFSHLAGSDDATHDAFSRGQYERFTRYADKVTQMLGFKPLRHLLNSAGILRLTDMQLDMVRLGIGLYGVDPTAGDHSGLRPAASLKTRISQVKEITAGESIGYGRVGRAESDIRIGVMAIGYADGYSRAFSNGVGQVLINGRRARVIGNVCMDMTMVNITNLDVREGDVVTLFGQGMAIQEVAATINTIPYEILTNTSERVKRVFRADGI
jgi:alanine racemase